MTDRREDALDPKGCYCDAAGLKARPERLSRDLDERRADPMNYDIRLRYLARVFLDAQGLTAQPEQGRELAVRLTRPDLQVHTVLEMRPGDPRPRSRLVMSSPRGDWHLAFLGESFDFTRSPADPHGLNMGSFREFAAEAARILPTASEYFGRLPHRIALLQEGVLGPMSGVELEGMARRCLRLPPGFESASLFEWDWRVARHGTMQLGGRAEQTNILAGAKRISGEMMSPVGERIELDRVRVDLDVNTAPADTRGRFNRESIAQFFALAIGQQDDLEREIDAFLFERGHHA